MLVYRYFCCEMLNIWGLVMQQDLCTIGWYHPKLLFKVYWSNWSDRSTSADVSTLHSSVILLFALSPKTPPTDYKKLKLHAPMTRSGDRRPGSNTHLTHSRRLWRSEKPCVWSAPHWTAGNCSVGGTHKCWGRAAQIQCRCDLHDRTSPSSSHRRW